MMHICRRRQWWWQHKSKNQSRVSSFPQSFYCKFRRTAPERNFLWETGMKKETFQQTIWLECLRSMLQLFRKDGGHRALGDIQDSIEELKYYRRTVFKQWDQNAAKMEQTSQSPCSAFLRWHPVNQTPACWLLVFISGGISRLWIPSEKK